MREHNPGEKLRIAQVIGTFGGGGAERQAYNLAVGLGELGCDSVGVSLQEAGDFIHGAESSVRFISLAIDKRSRFSVLCGLWRFRRFVRRFRPHVVHVQGTGCLPFVVHSLRWLRKRPHLCFTWQDSQNVLQEAGPFRRRMVPALRKCDAIFGSSERVARTIADTVGLQRVGVFHGGVAERPESVPSLPPVVLWIGRLVPAKGPMDLIRCAAVLRREGHDFSVVLVGGGHAGSDYGQEVLDEIEREGLAQAVSLVGHVEEEVLSALLRAASIGVQTSYTEGLSMALLEEMMAGLAIVATDVGDTREALNGGRCGLVVRPRDDGDLIAAMRSVILDKAARSALGRAARQRALSEYAVSAMCRRAIRVYEGLAQFRAIHGPEHTQQI